MSLSKKHYKAIAEIVGKTKDKEMLVAGLMDYFKEDNPRFDYERFEDYVETVKARAQVSR